MTPSKSAGSAEWRACLPHAATTVEAWTWRWPRPELAASRLSEPGRWGYGRRWGKEQASQRSSEGILVDWVPIQVWVPIRVWGGGEGCVQTGPHGYGGCGIMWSESWPRLPSGKVGIGPRPGAASVGYLN